MGAIIDWNRLKYFFFVAGAGGFSQAAAKEGVSQSSLSRQISALEEEIGAPLFHRHPRGLILTERGEVLYQAAKDVYKKIICAEGKIGAGDSAPSGRLCVTSTHTFGSMWLASYIPGFIKRYPDIQLDLMLDDQVRDLAMREADIAVRMWKPEDPGLISDPFIKVSCHYYASEEVCEKYGKPKNFKDLNGIPLVAYSGNVPELNRVLNAHVRAAEKTGKARIVYSSNNLRCILFAVEAGLGIGALPSYLSLSQGKNNLTVLNQEPSLIFQTYFVYPEALKNVKKVTVFREYLKNCAQDWGY